MVVHDSHIFVQFLTKLGTGAPGPNDASDQAALEVLRKCLVQFWQGSFHLF